MTDQNRFIYWRNWYLERKSQFWPANNNNCESLKYSLLYLIYNNSIIHTWFYLCTPVAQYLLNYLLIIKICNTPFQNDVSLLLQDNDPEVCYLIKYELKVFHYHTKLKKFTVKVVRMCDGCALILFNRNT